jgi:hypothetical protein
VKSESILSDRSVASEAALTPAPDTRYYIASLKHTVRDHEHITFWGADHRGYVLVIQDGHTGEYTLAEAQRLNDGLDCLAVPVDAVKALLSPQPYYRNGWGHAARFYDTPGPVVDNTRANWNRLIAAALPGQVYKPKPEVCRRTRRSFALEVGSAPGSQADTNGPAQMMNPESLRPNWQEDRKSVV